MFNILNINNFRKMLMFQEQLNVYKHLKFIRLKNYIEIICHITSLTHIV